MPRLAAAVKGETGELNELKELSSPGIHIHRLADSCSRAHSHLQTFHSHHPNRLMAKIAVKLGNRTWNQVLVQTFNDLHIFN